MSGWGCGDLGPKKATLNPKGGGVTYLSYYHCFLQKWYPLQHDCIYLKPFTYIAVITSHTKAKNTLQTDLHLTDVFTIFLKCLKSAVANCCFPPQAVRVGTPSMCSWLHRFCNTLNSWSITSAVPGFFISFIGVYRIGANRRRIFQLCVWLQPYSTLQRLLVDIICITTGAPVLKLRFSKLYSTVYCGS